MSWTVTTSDYSAEAVADNGNRFLIGNGVFGVRGTLEEHRKDALAAVNLAGLYGQVGDGWREPLNAPNPLYTLVTEGGEALSLPKREPLSHLQSLDFRAAVMERRTAWKTKGGVLEVCSWRFASLSSPGLLCAKFRLTATAPTRVTLDAGIDGDVWDIHGPHYESVEFSCKGTSLSCIARVQNSTLTVPVTRRCTLEDAEETPELINSGRLAVLRWTLDLRPGHAVTLTSICAVNAPPELALDAPGYDALLTEHRAAWEEVWRRSAVEIDGDEEAETAVNYSLYQLNAAAPRDGGARSIPARGLSGQTYKGAIFWDSELFMLDYFLHTQPEVARSLVRYRIDTLPGALEKARQYGHEGAFYAWESQEGGRDACSDYNVVDVFTGRPVRTYFRDKQVHISAAVVWALIRYVSHTGDRAILREGGAEVVAQCARFYLSLLVNPLCRERYELRDVLGPDEYHERVDNNAYTSRMAAFVFDAALAMPELAGEAGLLARLRDAREKLYLPAPDERGLIEQFDGYFALENVTPAQVRARLQDPREYWGGSHGVAGDTQVIKQADVAALLALFPGEHTPRELEANWRYYEPRTEHGSSLSACMYAMLACRFGRSDLALPFFHQTATAELRGGGKQWAGLVYIGGSHLAAAGGAWKVLAEGFAGLRATGDHGYAFTPCLPEGWRRVRLRLSDGENIQIAEITHTGTVLCPLEEEHI